MTAPTPLEWFLWACIVLTVFGLILTLVAHAGMWLLRRRTKRIDQVKQKLRACLLDIAREERAGLVLPHRRGELLDILRELTTLVEAPLFLNFPKLPRSDALENRTHADGKAQHTKKDGRNQ
jgi:hypothetical protein